MIENPFPLKFQPGLFRNGTKYEAKGRWYDSNLVRWFEDAILPIGGWDAVRDNQDPPQDVVVTGFPRGAWAWRANDSGSWLAIGTIGGSTTTTKVYVYADGTKTDISDTDMPAGDVNGGVASAVDIGGAYGSGPYGVGPFSSGTSARTIGEADIWSLDNFGENLVGVSTADEVIRLWDHDITHKFAAISGAPSAVAVVVTPEHFLLALGAGGDVRKVQWPDQNTTSVWTGTDTNQAGDEVLATEGRLMAGVRIRRQTLIWSDADVNAATYVGGDDIYRFDQVGSNCGLIAPWAWAKAAGAVYWMSDKKFFKYDGAVQEIRCDVSDDIFNDLNITQRAKIATLPLPQYNEIWWFFPSKSQSGLENDRYVVHNYTEGTWYVGRIPRAAAVPRGIFDAPLLLKPTGELLQHETGFDHEGLVPFAESGPIEIGDGQQNVRVESLIPDEKILGQVQATFFIADGPLETEETYGPVTMTSPYTDLRFETRQLRIRLEQVIETSWRIGVNRLGIIPAGKR